MSTYATNLDKGDKHRYASCRIFFYVENIGRMSHFVNFAWSHAEPTPENILGWTLACRHAVIVDMRHDNGENEPYNIYAHGTTDVDA